MVSTVSTLYIVSCVFIVSILTMDSIDPIYSTLYINATVIHSSFHFPHSTFPIPLSPFHFPHSSLIIPHSSFLIHVSIIPHPSIQRIVRNEHHLPLV